MIKTETLITIYYILLSFIQLKLLQMFFQSIKYIFL